MASLAGVAVAFSIPEWSDLLLLAGPTTLACALLWLRSLLKFLRAARKPPARWVILDGSNVMHWNNGAPDISVVRVLLEALEDHGFTTGVIFDANAGHKLFGRYMHDTELGKQLGLPADRVMVVPKGTPADGYILEAARDFKAKIVTNDRFRDWAEQFPEVATPGLLIQGGYRDGVPYLKLPQHSPTPHQT